MRCSYSEYNIASAVNERKKRERERVKKKKRMKLLYVVVVVVVSVVATILFSMYVSVRSDGGK